ncbi:MAG: 50S ribosomal protein L21e [Candidatus Aenigmatarchaeota archaeon]
MVRTSKGFRTRTRQLLKKKKSNKFKPENYLKEFKAGDIVIIKINSSSHVNMPHSRFQGDMGNVVKKVGRSYMIKVKNKNKIIITGSEHLVKAN